MPKKHIENLETEVIEEVIVKPKTKAPSKVKVQPVIESSSSSSESEEELEKKPVRKSKATIYNVEDKPKRQPSQKQLENLEKGRIARDNIRKQRIKEREDAEKEQQLKLKQELEEKIVKKAILVKKKQLKKAAILEPTDSESDTPPPLKVKQQRIRTKPVQQDFPAPPRPPTIVYM
jgi:hypothetical protein